MGRTLGTPIGLFVPNQNVRPKDYKEMAQVPRPGHADYAYQAKYGNRAASGTGDPRPHGQRHRGSKATKPQPKAFENSLGP